MTGSLTLRRHQATDREPPFGDDLGRDDPDILPFRPPPRPEPVDRPPLSPVQQRSPSPDRRVSRTATWTAERVADRLAEVQAVLGVSGASHLVQHWWAEFERLNRVRPKTFLRLAEELARRGATVSDYFAAYERGRVEDVQGALDFLDWTFLHAQAVNAADPVRRAALEAEARHHHLEYEKFTHAKDGWYRVVADAKAAPGTADAVYRAGVDRFPTSAPLRAAYAAYLNGAGRAVDAEAAAWAAVDLDPRYWPGYTALGDILTSTGRPRHAAAAHRRAIDLDEYAPAAHAGLGYALSQLTPYEAGEVDRKSVV